MHGLVSVVAVLAIAGLARAALIPYPNPNITELEFAQLVALHNATHGETWLNSQRWLDPLCHPCTWFGVTCRQFPEAPHVMWIQLADNNLTGTMPDTLGWLQHLTRLNLRGNECVFAVALLLPRPQRLYDASFGVILVQFIPAAVPTRGLVQAIDIPRSEPQPLRGYAPLSPCAHAACVIMHTLQGRFHQRLAMQRSCVSCISTITSCVFRRCFLRSCRLHRPSTAANMCYPHVSLCCSRALCDLIAAAWHTAA